MGEGDRHRRIGRRLAVSRDDEARIELRYGLQPFEPVRGVHIGAAHERDAPVLHDVPGEEDAVRLDQHHAVAFGVRWPGKDHDEALATKPDGQLLVEDQIRLDDPCRRVDPRRKRLLPLLEAWCRGFVVGIVGIGVVKALVLGDDDGVRSVLERLQPVDMVGVIMADDDIADGRARHAPDMLEQRHPEAGRT